MMTNRSRAAALATAAICLALGFAAHAKTLAQTQSQNPAQISSQQPAEKNAQKGAVVTRQAKGSFDVKLEPQGTPDKAEGSTLARMSIDKQYHGDLDATGKGEMLTAVTDVKGSAGYVAMERIVGKLDGRSGSFVLQHSSTLTRGAPQPNVSIVPDSGTGELVGITGKMTGTIEDGKHFYELDYTLPATQ